MKAVSPHTAIFGKVRVTCAANDASAVRRRVERLLASTDLQPSGVPPSAILCVRRWRTRLRGDLAQDLREFARTAARPSRAPVPADANAALFLDEAELLACLARDWLDGTLRANWWWLVLLQSYDRGDPGAAAMREWEQLPEFVPAAIELLERHTRAIEFVRRLPEAYTERLLAGMLHAHGIGNPLAPKPALTGEDALLPWQPIFSSRADPWQRWVPEASAATFTPAARLLLAYALLLRRAPQIARAPWFASGVEAWRARLSEPLQPLPDEPFDFAAGTSFARPAAPDEAIRTASRARAPSSAAAAAGTADETPAPQTALAAPVDQAALPVSSSPREALLRESMPREAAPGSTAENTPPAAARPLTASADEARPARPASPVSACDESLPAGEDRAAPSLAMDVSLPRSEPAADSVTLPSIETAFGGAFFLLNAALHLNLYGDFTNPGDPGLELNIWDFVARFGQALAGDDMRADPVWPLLADLSGRSAAENPGRNFPAPDVWRIPPAWLDPFPEAEPLHANIAAGRLLLTHAAAFPVVDVPLAGRTPGQALAEEMQPYSNSVSPIEPGPAMPARSRLARWTAWLAAYLRARLAAGLGRDDGAALLCHVPALLGVTPAHVHVFIRLDKYPIEIRLAGLDRDPGWIPAAGRHISFHFD